MQRCLHCLEPACVSACPFEALFKITSEGGVAAGVRRIEALGHDTYPLENGYFSYRRATHRAEPDYGRHVHAIALASE